MLRIAFVAGLAVGSGCKDDSGIAHRVSTGPGSTTPTAPAPEPPGGPPTCAEVAHLAAAIAMPERVEADVQGTKLAVSGAPMRDGIERGVAELCRRDASTQDARACALGWNGNLLRERAQLRGACPGSLR
jgi:hypothetical protein